MSQWVSTLQCKNGSNWDGSMLIHPFSYSALIRALLKKTATISEKPIDCSLCPFLPLSLIHFMHCSPSPSIYITRVAFHSLEVSLWNLTFSILPEISASIDPICQWQTLSPVFSLWGCQKLFLSKPTILYRWYMGGTGGLCWELDVLSSMKNVDFHWWSTAWIYFFKINNNT